MTVTLRAGLAIAVALMATAAIGAGLVLVGSPGEARLRRFDERRVADLRQISRSVALYWTVNEALPESLAQVSELGGVSETPVDPETGAPYSYRQLDSARYELCAVFHRAVEDQTRRSTDEFWSHGEGRQCFDLAPTETGRRD